MDYVNLDLELSKYLRDSTNQETFCVHVVRSDSGAMPSDKAVPVTLTPEQRRRIGSLKKRGLTKEEMIERGEELGKMLFPANTQVRGIYDKCLNGLKEGQRLRIRLTLGNYALSDLPWEYAYILPPDTPDDQKDLSGFLVLNKQISLVRYSATEQKVVSLDPVEKGKLRMVAIMANPKKDPVYQDLKIGKEFEKIEEVLEEVPLVDPEPHPDATRQKLQDALIEPAHIFHFAGHGDFEGDLGASFKSTSGQGYIILLDEEGKGDKLPADKLASLLRASHVRLAVLTACETGKTDQINAWTGVAPALIRAGIPAVVGMQFTIEDKNAIAFSRQFYLALAKGLPIDAAVVEGRQAIHIQGKEDERDWGVPVLYLQTDKGVLFPKLEGPPVKRPDDVTAVKTGIGLIKELIGQEKAVADVVCLSKREIEITSRQIDKLELFKTIHDALHNIEFECLASMQASGPASPLLPFMMRFDSEKDRIEKAIHERRMNDFIYRLQLDRMKQAEDAFLKAVDAPSRDAYKEVISELNTLLSGAPPEIERCISDAATELNLDDLSGLMTKVREKLPAATAGRDAEFELFLKSIEALNRLREELKRRVSEHGYLQDLDKELRTFCVGKIIPRAGEWERIKILRARLADPFSEELKKQNKFLDAAEKKTEEARGQGDEQILRNNLESYFSTVRYVFRDVDSSLKEFCTRLSGEVNQPLQIILSMC